MIGLPDPVANLVATGAADNVINGGDGDDRITLDDAL